MRVYLVVNGWEDIDNGLLLTVVGILAEGLIFQEVYLNVKMGEMRHSIKINNREVVLNLLLVQSMDSHR